MKFKSESLAKLVKSIETGKRPKGGASNITEGVPSISGEHFDNEGTFRFQDIKYIPEVFFKTLTQGIIRENVTLIVKDGATTGKTAYLHYNFPYKRGAINEHVFMVNTDESKLLNKYFFYFTKTNYFDSFIHDFKSGATVGGIKKSFADNLFIPIPDINEQRRIVDKLDRSFEKINNSIEKININKQNASSIINNYLYNLFTNELKGICKKPLNEVANVARGKSKHRPRNDKTLFGGNYPFIQTGEVRNSKKYINTYSQTYNEVGLKQSKLWEKNTICLTIAANIGDVAILGIDACFPDSVVGITTTKMDHEFLYYYLKTLQTLLDSKANSAAQKNINLQILSGIEVPMIPMTRQKEISKKIGQIEEKAFQLIDNINIELETLNKLKKSILDSAFQGKL